MKTTDEQIAECVPQWQSLLAALIPDIADYYRCSDEPDDDTPGMLVTIGFTPETEERDAHPHWTVVYLYRDSNPAELASEAADEISEACVW